MDVADIEKLAHVRGTPAVSIVCRLDRRRPGNLEDPRRLTALRRTAVDAVAAAYDVTTTARVAERIDEAVASVDLEHPSDGVAIFVTQSESFVIALPFEARSRVAVAGEFALRELVDAAQRMTRAYVVVLASEDARCFEAHDHTLVEVRNHGFPWHIEPPRQADTPHRDLPIGEREKDEAHKVVVRAVDVAVGRLRADNALPVVLVGPVRDLAYFDEVTHQGDAIVARVHGNHQHDTAAALATVVGPALDTAADRRRAETIRRAEEALGGPATTGLDECCDAAQSGRGRELVLEHNLGEGTGDAERVDRLVDDVLAKGGMVSLVPSGALAAHGGVVLILRY